jgi:hypothetical protein
MTGNRFATTPGGNGGIGSVSGFVSAELETGGAAVTALSGVGSRDTAFGLGGCTSSGGGSAAGAGNGASTALGGDDASTGTTEVGGTLSDNVAAIGGVTATLGRNSKLIAKPCNSIALIKATSQDHLG